MSGSADRNNVSKEHLKKLVVENLALQTELKALRSKLKKADKEYSEDSNVNLDENDEVLRKQTEVLAYLTTHNAIGTGDTEKAKKILTEAAAKTLKVERVSIWLLSEAKDELVCIDLFECSKNKHSSGMVLNAGNFPNYFESITKNSIVSADDALENESTSEFAESYLIPNNISSMLDAIVFDEKGIAGVVCFEHVGAKRKWKRDEEYFANIIASMFMSCRAIAARKTTEDHLRQKNDEYEAQNEEYIQINEELKQTLDDLFISKEKLEQSEKQINTILGFVDEMIWSQDYNSDVINYMSPSVKKVLGRDVGEFLNSGSLWKEIIHPEDVDYVLQVLENFQPRKYIELEYRIIHPDGSVRWVFDRTKITYDEKNKPIRLDGIVSDITERKITEEKSKKQTNKINTILKTMPDLLFVVDKDGFYQEVFSNDPAVLLIPPDKISGINALDVFGDEEGQRHIEAFRKCLSTKNLQLLEYEIEDTHKTLYFEARLSPLDEENVLCIVRDITERKESVKQLSTERDILQQLMDNIPDLIYFKDKKGRYTRINKAKAKLLGLDSPEDAQDRTDFDFFDKDYAKKIFDEETQMLKKKVPIIGKVEKVVYDSGLRWIYTTKIPITDANNEITGLVGISRDITDLKDIQDKLKMSEEQYRLVTENAFDGIYLRNDKNFEYVNERFCMLSEYSKEELCSEDFNLEKFDFKETSPGIAKQLEQTSNLSNVSRTYEGTIICKSGKKRQVEFSTTFIKRNDKKLVLGVMRDISERKKNEELNSEIAVTRKSAEFKQNFLANMSHEMRTPLTGILGMIEMIDKTKLDAEQRNFLNILKNSTANLREIINQVLDFSKIEAGKIKLKTKAFDFKVLMSGAHDLFANICNKEIKFETYIDPSIPDFIKADKNRITQIINNLISNAVKFTDKGNINVNAYLMDYDKKNNDLIIRIEVSDSGIGIKPEKQKQLFIPFSQIEELDTRDYDGTGLGLSICKELVQLHGGEIGFNSEYSIGSTFWFTFKAEVVKCKSEIQEHKKAKVNMKTGSLNILFAEDKLTNQKVVKLMLNHLGHNVTMAKNGKEAIEIFKNGKFDLIIMDIQMPVMDGITATNILKKNFSDLPPIVGLSANAFEGDKEKYIKQGMDDYMTKPFQIVDFEDLFERIFNK